MANFFNNQHLLETLWKWKKHLIIVGVLAVVASAFFSSPMFIKPKFKSTARIYPSKNIYIYSEESETEQMLEFINSMDIKLKVIDAFNLSEEYKVPKSDPQYLSTIMAEFNENINFKKTEFETIEITVLNHDPQKAAVMCDSIISFLDEKIREIHRGKYEEVVSIAKSDLSIVSHQSDSVKQKLDEIRRDYKIFDYESQAEEITKGMAKVLAEQKKNTAGGKELEQWMKNLAEKGGEFQILDKLQKSLTSQIDSLKKQINQAESGVRKKISYGQIVERPIPADKKAYPVRWLIVLMSAFAAEFLAMITVIFLETKKTE